MAKLQGPPIKTAPTSISTYLLPQPLKNLPPTLDQGVQTFEHELSIFLGDALHHQIASLLHHGAGYSVFGHCEARWAMSFCSPVRGSLAILQAKEPTCPLRLTQDPAEREQPSIASKEGRGFPKPQLSLATCCLP